MLRPIGQKAYDLPDLLTTVVVSLGPSIDDHLSHLDKMAYMRGIMDRI